jgi:catechol 2,3-dioxygenase-like lactoylglutathione lyase family enzyme
MTTSATPSHPPIDCEKAHAVLAVSDIPAAIEFYTTKLGFWEAFRWGDPPGFAGVNLGQVQVFLQKGTPNPNPNGSAVCFVVGDADALYAFHRANGVEITCEIGDREYGLRDYGVRDLYGYNLSFGQYMMNQGPKIKVERVDVPLRLEKRLAALVQDLAKHKSMTVDSMFEEMLLHTNDGVEPHTTTTVKYIQELKKRHGIDYDTHASYRFVEE